MLNRKVLLNWVCVISLKKYSLVLDLNFRFWFYSILFYLSTRQLTLKIPTKFIIKIVVFSMYVGQHPFSYSRFRLLWSHPPRIGLPGTTWTGSSKHNKISSVEIRHMSLFISLKSSLVFSNCNDFLEIFYHLVIWVQIIIFLSQIAVK